MILANHGRIFSGIRKTTTQNDLKGKSLVSYNKNSRGRWDFFLNKFIYLLIYFWLPWVFVAAHGLSLVAASRGYSSLRCAGFLLRWLLLLWSTDSRLAGSVVVACGL